MGFNGSGFGSGAASGAVIGTQISPGYGTAIGAAAGGLMGGFMGGDDISSPSFSDIDLEKENPALYRELMRLNAAADQAEMLYNQRIKGLTENENRQLSAAGAGSSAQLSSRGLLGTSAGLSAQGDLQAKLHATIAEQAQKEQAQLLQQEITARQAAYNATRGAQQDVMGVRNQDYQQQLANSQAKNQFMSGLVNGGLSAYGNYHNMNAMDSMGTSGITQAQQVQLNQQSGGFNMPQTNYYPNSNPNLGNYRF